MKAEARRELWPVDRLMLGYLAATGALVAVFHTKIAGWGLMAAAHVAGMLLIVLLARGPGFQGAKLLHFWYPVLYIAALYRELSVLIPLARHTELDAALARWDFALWRVHPTVWLERFETPWLTELLQIAYALFVPAVLVIPIVFQIERRKDELRRCAFVLSLGFLVSYAGYFAVPARGPRFFLAELQKAPLEGVWLYGTVRHALDVLESAQYDCFPSGHAEVVILAWWLSRRIAPWLFRAYALYTAILLLATVYLRYHYTVDLLAGLAVAAVIVAAAALAGQARKGPLERH
jgi:membrane-associated phospholipid phosphatase